MKVHKFDSLSFLSGLVMAVIGLVFLVPRDPGEVFSIFGDIGNWFWPVVFVAIGVAILAPLLSRAGQSQDSEETSEE